MLSIQQASNEHRDSIYKCFKTIFDENELKHLKSIKSLSLSYVGLDRRKEVGAFILVNTSDKYADYEIAYLGISPRYRSQGYAKKLIELVLKRLAGHPVWLNTLLTNETACSLYEKMGFKRIKTFKDRFGVIGVVYLHSNYASA
jgi:ribosomal protein S18 acetylase RimI-like enzyme